jgi:hypothetical protein
MAELLTMYPAQANSPETTLAGSLSATSTSATVLDGSVLPDAPNYLTIGADTTSAETVLMTAKNSNVLTITRGQNGTAARAWDKGDIIARYFTAADHDAIRENISRLNNGKPDKVEDAADGNFAAFGEDGGSWTAARNRATSPQRIIHTTTRRTRSRARRRQPRRTRRERQHHGQRQETGRLRRGESRPFRLCLVKYFQNVAVPSSAWVSSSTKPAYPYQAEISAAGVDSSWKPDITFSDDDAESGNFSSSANAGTNTVIIYAASKPTTQITILTIECKKAVT